LGLPLTLFPGSHVGCTEHPQAFADQLAETVERFAAE
jgi:hypothetical protein